MKKNVAVLRYLLSIHIVALVILSLFRCFLYLSNLDQVVGVSNKTELFGKAMLKGILFDNLIACYVLALPLLILSIFALCNKISKINCRIFSIYFITLYALIFAISAADIPYFKYFFAHMGGGIFAWLGFGGTTVGMLFQEPSYYLYIIAFIVLCALFAKAVLYLGKQLMNTKTSDLKNKEYVSYILLTIVALALCFVGIRGGMSDYPLRVSNAYFSNNAFFNQLGLNPAFFLIKSSSAYFKKHNNLAGVMEESEAIQYVQKALNITPINAANPLRREIITEGEARKANVVIVLMESMSSNYLDMEYKGNKFTPYLNELIEESYYFNNFYSTGTHTNNGVGSSLFGYPVLFNRPMFSVDVVHYDGLPLALNQKGYESLFFLAGDPQFDHLNSALLENGFNRIYSQDDFPKNEVVNTYGVADKYLFEYSTNILDEKAEQGIPFLATILTGSNHAPYIVPKEFKDIGRTDEESIVPYADNCIKIFMENAKQKNWYKNTIFVFFGDHGRVLGRQIYDMALSYNHVPLIIHSPLFNDTPQLIDNFGSQIDVFPTIMGLLNQSYSNNTLGTDLMKEKHRYTSFVSDSRLGCISDQFVYIYDPSNKTDGLYKYRDKDVENVAANHLSVMDSMKTYAISMLITTDYMINNKLTGAPKK